MQRYYDRRAPEYDDWYLGTGLFAERERPGWDEELRALKRTIAELPHARVLDAACGTGFLTRHLEGEVTELDQSERMLKIARARVPEASFVRGDALALPFPPGSFERVFTARFYGHLHEKKERKAFLKEARRVAAELIVVDAALRPDKEPEELQERILSDGSRHEVYKRYFGPAHLAEELGASRVLFSGGWFVMVAARIAWIGSVTLAFWVREQSLRCTGQNAFVPSPHLGSYPSDCALLGSSRPLQGDETSLRREGRAI